MDREKLMKMASAVRTGGKGTVRRKKKAVHKTSFTDEKKVQATLKRFMVNPIPGIEEVSLYKDDTVIQFVNPKVQAAPQANIWAVSGPSQTKKLQDLLPAGLFDEFTGDLDSLKNLKKFAEQLQNAGSAAALEEDDDDVPDLVPGETFETAAVD